MGTKVILLCLLLLLVSDNILGQNTNEYNNMIKYTSLSTNSIVLGEALALCIGMHLLSKGDNTWISSKNDILLGLDIVSSVALLYLTLSDKQFYMRNLTYCIAGISLLTHAFRTIEYFGADKNQFCANVPLMVVNNVKLIGLGIIIGQGLLLKYTIRF